MKTPNIYKALLIIAFMLPFFAAKAQIPYVKQVLIANGGNFGNPGNKITIGSYDPVAKKYKIFDSVPGGSVTQILVDTNGTAYMATDSFLVKYDLTTLKRTGIVEAHSIRYLAFYKDNIGASIGEDGNFSNFKMFKKSDLSLVYRETKLKTTWCEGLTIQGDSAYIAMQGSYPYRDSVFPFKADTGKIGVLDLVNMKVKRTIYLDTLTRGLAHMFSGKNYIVATTENYPPDNSYISKVDLKTGAKKIVAKPIMYSPFALYDDSLYAYFNSGLTGYNVVAQKGSGSAIPAQQFLAGAYDTINNLFYLTGLDFTNPTLARVYNHNGTETDSFHIGVSPQGIAIQYAQKSGINEAENFSFEAQLFPNPAKTDLYLSGINMKNASISISDIAGKIIFTENKDLSQLQALNIPVEMLPIGVYILNVRNSEGTFSKKFIKN